MAYEFLSVSDGTFSLLETENENQFYFYRNDGDVLTNIDREPMDLYHAYIMRKMINDEMIDKVTSNIYLEMSDDKTYIKLTVCDIGKKTKTNGNSTVRDKRPNFMKRLIHKIFG